jgi:hypothetical protein
MFGRSEEKRLEKAKAVVRESYLARVRSNELAMGVVEAEQAGVPGDVIAWEAHNACWEGALLEAARQRLGGPSERLGTDRRFEGSLVSLLKSSQVNQLATDPVFSDSVVDDLIERVADPTGWEIEQLEAELEMLQAEEAPLMAELERMQEIERRIRVLQVRR